MDARNAPCSKIVGGGQLLFRQNLWGGVLSTRHRSSSSLFLLQGILNLRGVKQFVSLVLSATPITRSPRSEGHAYE